jgi:NAD(P)-dependent dehydrogenase (short-subunit alcohol dehydrogenase family)
MTEKRKRAVVTGGSKGIGRAIVLALAAKGYDVAIFDILADAGEATAQEATKLGTSCVFHAVDVGEEAQVAAAAKTVAKRMGALDVLVNNAGIFPRAAALDMPYALWQKVLGINLGGTFLCSRAFAPAMRKKGGSIVNIASGRGLQGTPMGSHYAASKAGIISLTRSLALEWAPDIRVNAIVPGVTDTDQPREAMQSEEELYARGKCIPLGRIGQPEDIAHGVCLLISEDAGYITGQSLCVNGGAIMQ